MRRLCGGLGGGCARVARTTWGHLAERPRALHEASPDGLSSIWRQTTPTVALGSRSELPERPEVEVAVCLRPGSGNSHGLLQPCSVSHSSPRAGPHSRGGDMDSGSPWNGGQRPRRSEDTPHPVYMGLEGSKQQNVGASLRMGRVGVFTNMFHWTSGLLIGL